MKKRFLQAILSLILILTFCFSLTGCSRQTYQKAIRLYNDGRYDAAATLFSQLGDYENSQELFALSRYWDALTLMSDGEYSKALPRFIKLGDYEDSADRAVECTYQMAIAAFESGDLKTAESYFLEHPQYRKSPEYLRQITWQKLFDAVAKAGTETEAGNTLQKNLKDNVLCITAAEPDLLILSVNSSKSSGFRYSDSLTLTLSRDSLEAAFCATSSFAMAFVENEIGSVQDASGTLDISVCTPGIRLAPEEFQITVTDNRGNTYTSKDPAECLMEDAMADNLSLLLTEIPLLLTESGIDLTLTDIGFAAT